MLMFNFRELLKQDSLKGITFKHIFLYSLTACLLGPDIPPFIDDFRLAIFILQYFGIQFLVLRFEKVSNMAN